MSGLSGLSSVSTRLSGMSGFDDNAPVSGGLRVFVWDVRFGECIIMRSCACMHRGAALRCASARSTSGTGHRALARSALDRTTDASERKCADALARRFDRAIVRCDMRHNVGA